VLLLQIVLCYHCSRELSTRSGKCDDLKCTLWDLLLSVQDGLGPKSGNEPFNRRPQVMAEGRLLAAFSSKAV
jgi:hypothetical protein